MALALSWVALSFPPAFDADQVLTFTRLLATRPVRGWWRQPDPIVCEVIATTEGVRWQVGMTSREAAMLWPQLRGQLPAVTTDPTDRALPPLVRAWELRPDNHARPLRTDVPAALAAALLPALADLHDTEALVWSWVIGPPLARPAIQPGDALDGFLLDQSEEVTAARAKVAEPMVGAVARVGVAAAGYARQAALVQRVVGSLELAASAGAGLTVRPWRNPAHAARRLAAHRGPLLSWPPLNAAELATVLGWPVGSPYLPGVTYSGYRKLPPNAAHLVPVTVADTAPPGTYRVIGRATWPTDTPAYVHQPVTDARYHTQAVGPTGSGKSVMLAHLIEADIAAGRSVLVIDPKADLVAAVADRIPRSRADDVVWIDPTDPDFAVGFNVLAGDPELAADRFTHILGEMFASAWGPKTAQVVYNAAATLARARRPLVELPLLLTDPTYRAAVVAEADDPLGVGSFWQWFHSLSEREQTATAAPAVSRVEALLGRRVIRGVIGQPSPRFALADLFARPCIVLVALSRGLIGPTAARLLGGLVLSQFWQGAMAQVAVPEDQRRQVSAVVDEFQDYAAGVSDFGEALAQSRGFRVAWTLAHQGLFQLDTTTATAVLVNARSRVVWQQTAASEARELAASLGGDVTPQDVSALGAYQVYASLAHAGATLPPVSVAALAPLPSLGTAATIARRSRVLHGTPRADLDGAIIAARRRYCTDHTDARPNAAGAMGGRRPRSHQPRPAAVPTETERTR